LRAFAAKGGDAAPRTFAVTQSQLLAVPALQDQLITANEERGLYFVVNAGGDADDEIVRFNAFFAEIDDLPIKEQHALFDAAPLVPSIRVESLKSIHAYWLIDGACSEAEWRDIQLRLIAYFNSDLNIKNPSRVMRLPYFNHVSYNKETQTYSYKPVAVLSADRDLRFTVAEMQEAFPSLCADSSPASENYDANTPDLSTWDALNSEARRRIRNLKTSINGDWIHAKGVCHGGRGDKALFVNLETNAYGCMAGCDTATILRSLGLPEQPQGSAQVSITSSWRDFSRQKFEQREQIIFGLEPKEVGVLLASTNVGKTTLALNLSLHLAAGGKFEPLLNERKQGGRTVLYIDGESRKARLQADVARMLKDWSQAEHDLIEQNFHVICDEEFLEEPLDLADYTHREQIRSEASKVKAELIVVDTMSALFKLVSENDNAEMQKRVMRPLAKLASDTGAAILMVHHIGKQSEGAQAGTEAYKGRGASAIGASARMVLIMKPDTHDESLVSLVCAKVKGPKFKDVLLRLGDSRWFTNTGKAPEQELTQYQQVVQFVVDAERVVKREEIESAFDGRISASQVGKHLKAAVERGALISEKHGYYSAPQNTQTLNAIDDEHLSISDIGVGNIQESCGENAQALTA
jgi:hypothetical protein